MKRILLLILAFMVCLGLALRGNTEETKPTVTVLPVSTKGTLIVYQFEGMRCHLFTNEDGMAKGAGGTSCIAWPSAKEFMILKVVKTEGSE